MKKLLLLLVCFLLLPFLAAAAPIVKGSSAPALSDEQCMEIFFTDLVTDYWKKVMKDDSRDEDLDETYVFNFLENSVVDNVVPENYLCALKAIKKESDNGIDWSIVKTQFSNVLDEINTRQGALICQNNRVWQVGAEGIIWIGTVIAAVFSFGSGGVAVQAGKVALKVLLKNVARTVAKAAGKKTARAVSKAAIKKGMGIAAKSAYKKITASIFTKVAAMGIATGAVWFDGSLGGTESGNYATVFYSLLESDTDNEIINCHHLFNNKCYRVCGAESSWPASDDLNTKAFIKILGFPVCASEEKTDKYSLHKMNKDGTKGEILNISAEKMGQIAIKIAKEVGDKGECDWKANDIDMYIGVFLHDPSTLEQSTAVMPIIQIVRVDD
jgi:hypothetical protein